MLRTWIRHALHSHALRAARQARRRSREARMAGKLDGRVGLITGVASGIGKAGALLFAREGAALTLLDVDPDGGARTTAEIEAAGGTATFVRGDVSVGSDVQQVVSRAVERYGKLDLL